MCCFKNYDGVFLRYLEKPEADKLLIHLHVGPIDGYYSGETTTHKVLRVVYYCPTLFKYAYNSIRKCAPCQKCVGKLKKLTFPLQPVTFQYPFQQWGLDFVGPISPPSSLQHKYIMTATYYFTRWVEAIPLKVVNTNSVTYLLESNILTRFGVLDSLVFDNASYFNSIYIT